jgi:hypothetical protein
LSPGTGIDPLIRFAGLMITRESYPHYFPASDTDFSLAFASDKILN